MKPGEIVLREGSIRCNEGRRTVSLSVTSRSDRTIQVTSHFHFFEVNSRLIFDREKAFGMHLDIPAGTSVRFEPGQTREVSLVEYGGDRRIMGFAGLVDGPADDRSRRKALERARARGYLQE